MESLQFKLLRLIFLMAFLIVPSLQHKDFSYCSDRRYQVMLTRLAVSLESVHNGNLLEFSFSAFTDQTISGGEMVIYLSHFGNQFHSEKYNICTEMHCPVSGGDFALSFSHVLPVCFSTGIYTFKLNMLSEDGGQLSCFAFNFTIPYSQHGSDL